MEAFEISEENVQVGLLIDTNCINAVMSINIIRRKGGGTYAYRLNCCVMGSINSIKKGSLQAALIWQLNMLHHHSFAMENSASQRCQLGVNI